MAMPVTSAARAVPWLGLGLLACAPSLFDGLSSGGSEPAEQRDAAPDFDASAEGEGDAGEDQEPDPSEDAAPLDTPDAAEDAGPPVPDAAPPDASSPACPEGDAPRPLRVPTQASKLVTLTRPPSVRSRGIGPSAWLGTQRMWVFPSTSLVESEPPPPPERPRNFPTSARDGAGTPWTSSAPASAWALDEVLDTRAAPKPLLTLAPPEYNLPITLHVPALIRDPLRERGGLLFVWKATGSSLRQPYQEVGIARVDDGGELAVRMGEPLFRDPDPLFGAAVYVEEGYVKLFACAPKDPPQQGGEGTFPCVVARAPQARVLERAAYQVYVQDAQGSGSWSSQLAEATPVMNASNAAFSISWNPYLGRYLAVHGMFGSNHVVLQTAPAIEGPWQERVEIDLPMPKAYVQLDAREQPELAQRCGQRIFISSFSPTVVEALVFATAGEVVLSYVDLE
jgi:Domain of unknown function (DUF4185)